MPQLPRSFCPRCLSRELAVPMAHNSVSRRDNKTYICAPCGMEEAMVDFALSQKYEGVPPPEAIVRENRMRDIAEMERLT